MLANRLMSVAEERTGPWGVTGISSAGSVSGITDGTAGIKLRNFWIRNDGLRLYCGDYMQAVAATPKILQFNLSTAWDITTISLTPDASYDASGDVIINTSAPYSTFTGVVFNEAGTKLICFSRDDKNFMEYSLSVAWDISTLTLVDTLNEGGTTRPPTAIMTGTSIGKDFYLCGRSTYEVKQLELGTAFDLSTVTSNPTVYTNITGVSSYPNAWTISSDGLHAYFLNNDYIQHYTLSVPWDISGATYIDEYATITQESGIFVKPKGGRIYASHNSTGLITQYDLI